MIYVIVINLISTFYAFTKMRALLEWPGKNTLKNNCSSERALMLSLWKLDMAMCVTCLRNNVIISKHA